MLFLNDDEKELGRLVVWWSPNHEEVWFWERKAGTQPQHRELKEPPDLVSEPSKSRDDVDDVWDEVW